MADQHRTNGVRNAWSFLTLPEGERQHGGNEGYDDQPDTFYSWDSTVPNHAGPAVRDVCVLRDSRGALGVSRIEALDVVPDVAKTRRRCPSCSSTAFKARTSRTPRFRCSGCRAEFERPVEEPISVIEFRAEYPNEWIAIDGAVTARELESVYLSRAQQHAIRAVDVDALRGLLAHRYVRVEAGWWTHTTRQTLRGGRRAATAWRRVGQDAFRRALLERFGARCLISGPQPVEILQAAHLSSFAGELRHDPAGGLLLRADLHLLFDTGLISIGPDLRVSVKPALRAYSEIWELDGRALSIAPDDPLLAETRAYLDTRARALDGRMADGRTRLPHLP